MQLGRCVVTERSILPSFFDCRNTSMLGSFAVIAHSVFGMNFISLFSFPNDKILLVQKLLLILKICAKLPTNLLANVVIN